MWQWLLGRNQGDCSCVLVAKKSLSITANPRTECSKSKSGFRASAYIFMDMRIIYDFLKRGKN